jgi:predicted GNAT family acetyltransferase
MPVEIRKNPQAARYELFLDGQLTGIADYRTQGATVVFPHTEVKASQRGRGYGAMLVRFALDDARQAGAVVVPRCWYVAEFIRDNPDYADLLAA